MKKEEKKKFSYSKRKGSNIERGNLQARISILAMDTYCTHIFYTRNQCFSSGQNKKQEKASIYLLSVLYTNVYVLGQLAS